MLFPLDPGRLARREIPDDAVRKTLRFGLAGALRRLNAGGAADHLARKMQFVRDRRTGPVAIATDSANVQHYEVPAAFFQLVLGPRLAYSGTAWPDGVTDLAASEAASFALICDRARLADGQRILDLGCGWGAFTLHAAERYPHADVVAVSNSRSQRAFIEARARERGLARVRVHTVNVADDWQVSGRFDRIVSIEMFEHMRNYDALLARLASLLTVDGHLFVHTFAHRLHAYVLDETWTGTRFFTGGLMPSADLLLYFQRDLDVVEHWCLDGTHYQRTADAWLARLDAARAQILDVLAATYGDANAEYVLGEWRAFLLVCSESFGYADGREWLIAHYLFGRRTS